MGNLEIKLKEISEGFSDNDAKKIAEELIRLRYLINLNKGLSEKESIETAISSTIDDYKDILFENIK